MATTYAKTGSLIRQQPKGVAFQLFDQKTLHLLEPRYESSTPAVADTLADLANQLDISPERLVSTVTEFNAATGQGEFSPLTNDGLTTTGLQPAKSNWALPLDAPPFVAYPVQCGITFTYGGLRTDLQARVLNLEGKPMPGLWAVGEMSGGAFYHNYPGGSGLPRGATFGWIAGEAAAAEAHR